MRRIPPYRWAMLMAACVVGLFFVVGCHQGDVPPVSDQVSTFANDLFHQLLAAFLL